MWLLKALSLPITSGMLSEQYVECTHEYWRSNGKFTPNITLRLASGGYIGGGLYHSQNLEGALTTLPGARIVCPSFADDAAGLLRTSMRSKDSLFIWSPKRFTTQ